MSYSASSRDGPSSKDGRSKDDKYSAGSKRKSYEQSLGFVRSSEPSEPKRKSTDNAQLVNPPPQPPGPKQIPADVKPPPPPPSELKRNSTDGVQPLKPQSSKPKSKGLFGVKIEPKKTEQKEPKKKMSLASVFNEDSEPEEEEMPLECRQRMRNIGRETPTSSGPKSFNKGKNGFMNKQMAFELSMKPKAHPEQRRSLDDGPPDLS